MHTIAKQAGSQAHANVAHIVIVEDDATIAGLMQDALEAEGFRVSIAGSGIELRPLLNRESIQLKIGRAHV